MNELSDGEEVVGRSEGQEVGAKTEEVKKRGATPQVRCSPYRLK
ncbi:hypothetical protein [uncultured Porphyromonas sp.]|nr:hypothetical protein [uncultured Porphyromonas sp.]